MSDVGAWLDSDSLTKLKTARVAFSAARQEIKAMNDEGFFTLLQNCTRAMPLFTSTLAQEDKPESIFISLLIPEMLRRFARLAELSERNTLLEKENKEMREALIKLGDSSYD